VQSRADAPIKIGRAIKNASDSSRASSTIAQQYATREIVPSALRHQCNFANAKSIKKKFFVQIPTGNAKM
jgi:predicted restriction endonuclease